MTLSNTSKKPLSHQSATHSSADTTFSPSISIGKVVCVGRNYAAHAAELGNDIPTRPILFIKPASSVVSITTPIPSIFEDVPRKRHYRVHYETELCIRLGKDLSKASVEDIKLADGLIDAVTLGLDLTLRDLQSELKDKGHPWERAKSFDGSCVLGDWVSAENYGDFSSTKYQLYINNELTQDGDTALMLFPVYQLLSEISYAFSLKEGDIIMTGTPSGVGELKAGDNLRFKLGEYEWKAKVV